MDSSQFRSLRTAAEASNFRSVIGFWSAAMQEMGIGDDIHNQVNYILAITYALVCRRKSLQNIVLDAYLLPDSSRRSSSTGLPQDVRDRIRSVVESRDRNRVQAEVAQLLKRFTVPPRIMPLLQEACRRWVGRGIVAMRRHGNDGVEEYLREVDCWMQRFRKRSDRWVRYFLDLFGYECKAAFHTCYANAWIGLIPWLREHRGLDQLSERFMRFWHNQNQPVEIPHGQTAGGVVYPTRRGIALADNDGGRSRRRRRSLSVTTERIGPTHVPDVFHGQVLSLHPMAAFFMKDAALCATAGKFFGSDAYVDAQNPRLIRRCSEYWELVDAVLTATHVYRQAVDRQSNIRGTHTRGQVEVVASHEADDLGLAVVFEEFAGEQRWSCSRCQGRLRYVRHTPPGDGDAPVRVHFSCNDCGRRQHRQITWGELAPWLTD